MSYPAYPAVDLHVHTVASGHAYSTIGEISAAAAAKGLAAIGMTDHGPALPGGPHDYHFAALRFIPPTLNGVRVFKGIEANIIGPGRLDLSDERLERLELIMAGFHEECGYSGDRAANTAAVLTLMEQRRIHVLTHPGNPVFPLDYEAIARKGAETGVALEVNNASFTISRKGSADNCREVARQCARFGTPVSVGSDAHIAGGVGCLCEALADVEKAGVRWEQIVNRSLAATLTFLALDA